MTEFYAGTVETVIDRLYKTIACIDGEWQKQCVPAAEEQIQRLEDICRRYGYRLPEVYRAYLRAMGQNDGGLLEREWDGYADPCIGNILELFEEPRSAAQEDLQNGLLLFSYHWTEAHHYLRMDGFEDNPVVADTENEYQAGSFEKYLFQKAFAMYQEKFPCNSSVGTSINSIDAVLKKHGFPRSIHGGTPEERMAFARYLVEPYGMEPAWFSDGLHYLSYGGEYALKIDIRHSMVLVYSFRDPALKEEADARLNRIFQAE